MNSILKPVPRTWQVNADTTICGFEWKNNRPLALLSHANGFCASTWAPVARLLAPHYHVVVLDARGHGASSKPEAPDGYHWQHMIDDLLHIARQLIAEKGVPHIALVGGNSLGGVISAAAAADAPELFQQLVMLDPPLKPNAAVMAKLGMSQPDGSASAPIPGIADMARKRKSIWPSREVAGKAWRDKPIFANLVDEAFENYLKDGLTDRAEGDVELSCPPAVEAAIFDNTGSVDIFERARLVTCQVEVVHAKGGHFPVALYELLAETFSNGTLSKLDGGHLLPMEVPQLTAELLIRLKP